MSRRRSHRLAIVATMSVAALATVALAAPARPERDAPRLPQASGAWHIETAPDPDSQQEDLSLATSAVADQDATFSLWCRPAMPLYYFAIRDARLALRAGAEVTLSIRYPGEEPVRWQAASRGHDSVVVPERVHQTAFSLILMSLRQTTATSVDLAIDDHRWTFRLDGFAPPLAALIDACGVEPDPTRATARERSGPTPEMQQRNLPDLRRLMPQAK